MKTLDPRKGEFPTVGKCYRVRMHDLEFDETHDEFVRIVSIRRGFEPGFAAVWLTMGGEISTANFYGDDWYRTFTEVPHIQSPGRYL